MGDVRAYGPMRQSEPEPQGVRVYANGVVRAVVVLADGRRHVAWDYSQDRYR